MIGTLVGNYEVKEMIGDGGMGTVYLGEHATLGRRVAIKMLHPQYARNENIRERFRNEANTLSKLQHPNIVGLYDYIEDGDNAFLIMEYVEGKNLDDIVRHQTGPMPVERLAVIFPQILEAVDFAHSKGIIHRDIKPSNFILMPDDTVKVLDFGIAKVLGEEQKGLTKTGTRMGTVFYMSPEQVRGSDVDHRSDIYALGMMLFVLATGKMPYESLNSEFEIFNKIVHEELPPAHTIYPGVTARVEAMIRKATVKDARYRFQSCKEFRSGHGTNPYLPGNRPYYPGHTNPGVNPGTNPGFQNTGSGNTGFGNPGYGNPAYGNTGNPNQSYGNTGYGSTGYQQNTYPGQTQGFTGGFPTEAPGPQPLPGGIIAYGVFALLISFIWFVIFLAAPEEIKGMALIPLPNIIASIGIFARQYWARVMGLIYNILLAIASLIFAIWMYTEISRVSYWRSSPRPEEYLFLLLPLAHLALSIWGMVGLGRSKTLKYFK